MNDLVMNVLVALATPIVLYLVGFSLGMGWKHGRGELQHYMIANNPNMTLNNAKIMPSEQEARK
jgi:hypothetical protein